MDRNIAALAALGALAFVAAARLVPPATLGALWLATTGLLCLVAGPGRGRAALFGQGLVVALIFGAGVVTTVALCGIIAALPAVVPKRHMLALAVAPVLALATVLWGGPVLGALVHPLDGVEAVLPLMALAMPGLMLGVLADRLGDPRRNGDLRLYLLIPSLVAMVIAARMAGLAGAAAAISGASLVVPIALLLAPGPGLHARLRVAGEGIGVLAAAFVGFVGALVAQRLAGSHAAFVAGVAVYALALQVHAPAATRRIRRALGAVIQPRSRIGGGTVLASGTGQ